MAMLVLNGRCDRCGDTDLPMVWTCLKQLICEDCQEDLADIQSDKDAMMEEEPDQGSGKEVR